MLNKNKIKYIRSLKDKKNRIESGVFIAEGNKLVGELLPLMRCQLLVATSAFLDLTAFDADEIVLVTDEELLRVSSLKTPQQVLGVFYQPKICANIDFTKELCLALDGIQDPGNLGTIVRLADWYGIEHIFCTHDTADIYNPKTVQATMGAIARVKLHYIDLPDLLAKNRLARTYGTFLDGDNIYQKELSCHGIIVMGNEGNGIRPEVRRLIKERLYIPNFPPNRDTSESLNVAVATAIVCAEFRRRLL